MKTKNILNKVNDYIKKPQFILVLFTSHVILTTILYFIGKEITDKVTWFGMYLVAGGFWIGLSIIFGILLNIYEK